VSDEKPTGERVQKVIARAGLASRRAAEQMIREGKVTLNGKTCQLGDRMDPEKDWLKIDGKAVPRSEARRYLLLNKPAGYLSTVTDPENRRTVLDLIPSPLRRGMFPVGRLDYQSEGLILLTTDGEWAQSISHPRYGCNKTYEVKIQGRPDDGAIERLRRGISIEGKKTRSCSIESLRVRGRRSGSKNSWWTVTLSEGRNRQLRKMFDRIGHSALRIRRTAIGPVTSRGLPVGAFRELSPDEIEALREAGKTPSPRPTPPRKPRRPKSRRTVDPTKQDKPAQKPKRSRRQ
jgi:23S rRNA pseudouridine2605 synthase